MFWLIHIQGSIHVYICNLKIQSTSFLFSSKTTHILKHHTCWKLHSFHRVFSIESIGTNMTLHLFRSFWNSFESTFVTKNHSTPNLLMSTVRPSCWNQAAAFSFCFSIRRGLWTARRQNHLEVFSKSIFNNSYCHMFHHIGMHPFELPGSDERVFLRLTFPHLVYFYECLSFPPRYV